MTHNRKRDRSRKTKIAFVATIVVLSFLAVYFSATLHEGQPREKESLTDDRGKPIEVPENVQRIVSLAPSVTEILFVLGLEGYIVGVDDNSDYPEAALSLERVGGWIPDVEKIVALKPDLVIASDMTSEEVVASLEDKGLTVVYLAPKTVGGVLENIRLVGSITGRRDTAEKVVEGLERRIERITALTKKSECYQPTVYLEYYPYWTFGPGSFGDDLISLAGGRNIAADAAAEYINLSSEYIVGSNPEIIIFTTSEYTTTTIEEIRSRPGFSTVRAVQNNRIYTIDDDLLSRPGPRLVDALEMLAQLIHPELFPQSQNGVVWIC